MESLECLPVEEAALSSVSGLEICAGADPGPAVALQGHLEDVASGVTRFPNEMCTHAPSPGLIGWKGHEPR